MSESKAKAHRVQHNYRDYADVPEQEVGGITETGEAKSGGLRSDRTFPVRLHYLLSELERDGQDHIIGWQQHGRCFVIRKPHEFVDVILPAWFRQTKLASFQRQCNLYGFKRITTGRDKNAYYHEKFLRGKIFLAHQIQRIKIKGEGARKPSSPKTEPNFYAMSYLPPSPVLSTEQQGHNGTMQFSASSEAMLPGRLASEGLGLGGVRVGAPFFPSLQMAAFSPGAPLNPFSGLGLDMVGQPTSLLPSAALRAALLEKSLAMPSAEMLLAQRNALLATGLAPSLANFYRMGPMIDPTLANAQDNLRQDEDPRLLALRGGNINWDALRP